MARTMTADEEKAVRAFQRQVERLRQSSIVQSGKVSFKYTTNISFTTGEMETLFEGYDKVAFQSQLPLLRQFLLQDPVNFNRIHNIINQCCDRHDLLDWTRHARAKWMETLRRLPIDDHRFFHGANDTVEAAVEKLFYGYGGLFHVNPDDPEEEEEVREIQEATLQFAFPQFWNCLHTVDSVIHIWLDEPTKAVPPLPAS